MTADDLTALNDQIAAMARAGLPLDQGLEGLAREMGGGRLRDVTETLARDLRAGVPLPDALARQEGRDGFHRHRITHRHRQRCDRGRVCHR